MKKHSPSFKERYLSPKNVHILVPVMAELIQSVNTNSKDSYAPRALTTTTSDLTRAWSAQE